MANHGRHSSRRPAGECTITHRERAGNASGRNRHGAAVRPTHSRPHLHQRRAWFRPATLPLVGFSVPPTGDCRRQRVRTRSGLHQDHAEVRGSPTIIMLPNRRAPARVSCSAALGARVLGAVPRPWHRFATGARRLRSVTALADRTRVDDGTDHISRSSRRAFGSRGCRRRVMYSPEDCAAAVRLHRSRVTTKRSYSENVAELPAGVQFSRSNWRRSHRHGLHGPSEATLKHVRSGFRVVGAVVPAVRCAGSRRNAPRRRCSRCGRHSADLPIFAGILPRAFERTPFSPASGAQPSDPSGAAGRLVFRRTSASKRCNTRSTLIYSRQISSASQCVERSRSAAEGRIDHNANFLETSNWGAVVS